MTELCKGQFFLSIVFASIILNNKIQIYQKSKALDSKAVIPFWSPTSLLGSVLWRFVLVLVCVCFGLVLSSSCSCLSSPWQPALFRASCTTHRACQGDTFLLWNNSIVGLSRDKQEELCFHRKHTSDQSSFHSVPSRGGRWHSAIHHVERKRKRQGKRMENKGGGTWNLTFRFAFALWTLSTFHQIFSQGCREVI